MCICFCFKIKNSSRGITLVETIVVIFMIALFSVIVISDFPRIQRYFALSRASYSLAQDLRRTEDLGLSGVTLYDVSDPPQPIGLKGYGFYVNTLLPEQYVIYADVPNSSNPNPDDDLRYSGGEPYLLCSQVNQEANGPQLSDCVIELINITKNGPNLIISGFKDINGNAISVAGISINFTPPNPNINIEDDNGNTYSATNVGIVLGLSNDPSLTRTIWVSTSGLINVQ